MRGAGRVADAYRPPPPGRGRGPPRGWLSSRDTRMCPRPAQIVTHCILTLHTPFLCDGIDIARRFISTAQPPDNTARAAQDLSIFKENTSSSINLQVRGHFRKSVTNQTHIFPTPPARLPQATNTPKSTTETHRDLVKLCSAGASLPPVPGFGRESCVPPDSRSNMLRDPSTGWVPQSFMSQCRATEDQCASLSVVPLRTDAAFSASCH